MQVLHALFRWLPAVALCVAPSCNETPPTQDPSETNDDSASGTTFVPSAGTNTPAGSSSGSPETGTFDESGDDGPIGGDCDLFAQDCIEGEKCVPWSEDADFVPDDIRCCPVEQPIAQAGDLCSVEYLGSCIDNCAPGTMCFDIDGDGEGVCQELCGGTAEAPECSNGSDDECFIYYSGVPFCFAKCDPLVQGCPPDKGCYPDAIAQGGTGFLCMPTIGDQTLGEYCWLLAGCNPGMLCATPDVLPTCYGGATDAGCCTDLCDTTEVPDPCKEIHPDIECVPWYFQGAEPPSAELQNVGACALPTVGGS